MVRISLAEGRTACIDSTEVTREQYATFLADTNAHGAGTRLESCGKPPFRDDPDVTCEKEPGVCKGDCSRHPQVCVSHCNAQAFCAWAGKKICGTVTGVPATAKSLGDARVAIWLAACGGGSDADGWPAKAFPYGDTLDSSKCNTEGRAGSGCKASPATCGTVPTGSLPSCRGDGAFAGIFDMSGNAQEWIGLTDENARAPIPQANYRGGAFAKSFFDPSSDFACATSGGSTSIDLALPSVGIRCCAD
jgi:formylglycine-generating enzyme required for sulfatase activity